MTKVIAVLLAVLVVACTPDAPTTYAIDPAMPAAQAEVVRDTVRAWCASERAFCPVETTWAEAEGQIHWTANYARHGRDTRSCAFTDRGEGTIRVNADRAECSEDLHVFWLVMAHEVGHLSGLDGHGHGLAVMTAELDPTLPLIIQ